MLTARRLYLYGVSAAGLALLLAGLVMLVRLLFDQLGFGPTGEGVFAPATDRTREDLSLAIALTVVGLPLWLGHTWYAERMVRGEGPSAEAERQSVLRAVYCTLALAATLWAGAVSSADVLREGLRRAFGVPPGYYSDIPGSLAVVIVALLAWAYLAWSRARDVRAGPMRGAAAWVSRLGFYGAVLVGALAAAFALSDLIGTALRVLVGRAPVYGGGDWWMEPVTASVALITVGGLVWMVHWRYAAGLLAADHPWAADERTSRVRAACLLLVVAVSAGAVIAAFASAIGSALAWALGVAGSDDLARLAQDVVGPPLATAPFVAAWWWHARRATSEAAAFGGPSRERSVGRLGALLVSVVALAAAGAGAAWCLGLALDVAFGGSRTVSSFDQGWRTQLSEFAGYAIAATPVWLVAWYRVQARWTVAPDAEATSTARRAYLFLVGGVTLVAAAASLAMILYNTIRAVVGLQAATLASDLSGPAGVLLVATALLAYHAAVFRGDAKARTRAPATMRTGEAPRETVPAALGVPEATLQGDRASEELEITGPAGADFDALNAALRARLPAGFSLHVLGHPGAHGVH